jgi:hypothetical protein
MCNRPPVRYCKIPSTPASPFDISSLESEAVTRLFQEVSSHMRGVKIEMITNRKHARNQKEHPAATIGIHLHSPTILFVESLNRDERIEAISHELGHLLLVYRFGLGLVGLRMPHCENGAGEFCNNPRMEESWLYLLGQIPNTIHHLILIGYLKEKYGIKNTRHVLFLQHHFQKSGDEGSKGKDLSYARGLVASEYETLIGKVDRVINTSCQTESFWKAYYAAQKHFGGYSSESIPAPAAYKEDILSLLEELGYQREDFVFFPRNSLDR